MSGDAAPLAGPDLRATGLAAADLTDGAMVLGHADGEPVLMARHGDDVFAVSATCTHYGGPLAEGLLVGDTVRCPWHHACFSLRTGSALAAPALNPLACWVVERRGPRWHVGAKRPDRDPLAPIGARIADPGAPNSVVIIGAGAAGSAAAEMLRRQGYGGSITIVDGDLDSPYDRPNLSKDYLAGTAQEEWIPLRPPGFYDEHQIEIVHRRATSINPAQARIVVEGGSTLSYGALLLATGAEPLRLAIPGADRPFVHTLRSLADSRTIAAAAQGAKRAVVIGASFIGLEVAASLRHRGLEVHVVAPESTPLERVLDRDLGSYVRHLHEAHGVAFHLSSKPARIDDRVVVLEDGTSLSADLVVVGIGVRPRLDLAQQAGLMLDRGVVVDEYLETSAPGIFAAGDIARWPDRHTGARIRVEHWVLAQRQGQVAARNMLGARERFDVVPYFWSQHYGKTIRYSGHAEQWERVDVDGRLAEGRASVAYRSHGTTLAVASVGADRANLAAEAALERGDEGTLARIVPPR